MIGTGPYRIAEYNPNGGIRLVRNRHFEVWSNAAQPEGVPDEIVRDVTGTPDAQLTAVQRGQADIAQGVPADRRQEARTQYAAQFHVTPTAWTWSLVLNSTRPPFNHPLARQAVAYAVDRGRLVTLMGGNDLVASTCQLLPPNYPAHRPYCPYTLRPTEGGAWTAPDLETARRLVTESGTRGMRVDVLGPTESGVLTGMTTVLAEALRELGYRTSVKRLEFDSYFTAFHAGAARVEAAVSGWCTDYPAPGGYISGVLVCSEAPYACNPAVKQELRKLFELQTRNPEAANEAWTGSTAISSIRRSSFP